MNLNLSLTLLDVKLVTLLPILSTGTLSKRRLSARAARVQLLEKLDDVILQLAWIWHKHSCRVVLELVREVSHVVCLGLQLYQMRVKWSPLRLSHFLLSVLEKFRFMSNFEEPIEDSNQPKSIKLWNEYEDSFLPALHD